MKFNKTLVLATFASVCFVSIAFATPFLSVHRYGLTALNDDLINVIVMADSSILNNHPVNVTIKSSVVSHGTAIDDYSWTTPVSYDSPAELSLSSDTVTEYDISKASVSISIGKKQIKDCVATVSSGSKDPLLTAVTKTLKIFKTNTGYACSVS